MARFRFSIGNFLAVITLVALGMGAMAAQSQLAASLAFTVFLSLLGLATAVALVRGTANRAFWLGFAVFGWMYWFCEFTLPSTSAPFVWPSVRSLGTTQRGVEPPPGLITGHFLRFVESNVAPNRSPGSRVMARWNNDGRYFPATIEEEADGQTLIRWVDGGATQWTPSNFISPNSPHLLVAGHCLMGSLFALLGGVLAAVMSGKRPSALGRARSSPNHKDVVR